MPITEPICKVGTILTSRHYILIVISLIFFVLLIWLFLKSSKGIQKFAEKIIIGVGLFFSFLIIWIVVSLLTIISMGMIDDVPPTADYHALNAMIKYRCYQDHKYCPTTEQGVRTIAPDYLKSNLNNAQITYTYNAKTKDYILIIRNNNYHVNSDRVAIFASQLKQAKNYGNKGLDFFDADIIDNCNGSFTITNPPPFPGPWNTVN